MEIIIINFCTKAVKGQLAKRWHNKYIHDQSFNYKANFRQTGGLAVVTQIKMMFFFKKNKPYCPFYGWGSTAPRLQSPFEEVVPRNSWYSFYRPRKDERLSWPWSHPVVLNPGPLDWESSALITVRVPKNIIL